MKKILILLIAFIFVITACKQEKEADTLEGQITKNKETIRKLKAENEKLQQQLYDSRNGENGNARLLVTVKLIKPELFEHFFTASGSVEAIKEAFISAELSGQIKKIYVQEGQRVKKGELLIKLNSSIIEKNIIEIKTGLNLATTIFTKRQGLWKKNIGSEVQFLQAKNEKESLENRLKTLLAQLEMTRIKAPINGIVDQITRKEGELAVPGFLLIQLINLEKVYVNADISEAYLSKIKKGDPVTVSFPSFPEMSIKTKIYRIGNVIKVQNRTFKTQVILNNKDEKLKPNILSTIEIKDYFNKEAFIVPSIIIKNDLKGAYVYVTEKKAAKLFAKKIYIKPGISFAGKTLVEEGLTRDHSVITRGYNLVKNGSAIKLK